LLNNLARIVELGAILLRPASLGAHWLDYPTAGIPRAPDGTPDLAAPARRTAAGIPDLSGVWYQPDGPPFAPPFGVRYALNLAADLEPNEVAMTPAAAELFRERLANGGADAPTGVCQLPGVPLITTAPLPHKIVQTPGLTVILYEAMNTFRQIFTDGRTLPEEPEPAWMGYSVGRWDGDTFVVETAGFNDETWLDLVGHPHTEMLYVTERFQRRNVGNIDYEVTIDDPGAYTRPWTVSFGLRLLPDSDLLEFNCNENNRWSPAP
jgi:hypothetical protein